MNGEISRNSVEWMAMLREARAPPERAVREDEIMGARPGVDQ